MTAKRKPPPVINVYNPLAWQVAPWRSTAPVLLLTGSAGGGKSRLAAEKVHGFCKRYAGATGLLLRKAREYAGKSIIPFLLQTVIGSDPLVLFRKGDNTFSYSNGSTLYIGGMRDDSQREGVRSIGPKGGLDIVWMEEASQFTETDYNEVTARIRGAAAPWTQVILTTNPGHPSHWIKRRLIDGGEAEVFYSGAQDNPYNPPSYAATLGRLTGVLRLRLALGQWVQAEGAVYPQYNPAIHLIDPFPIPSSWRRLRVIDFGYTNPFVCQWWAQDGDGRLYRYRELYMTGRTVRAHAAQINALTGGEQIEATIADHDAEDRATLAENGIFTTAADKAITVGIQAVSERLAVAGDGRARLFLMRDALVEIDESLEERKLPTCTEEEIEGYAWPKAADGKPIREQPVKENDHGSDALRYLVMYVDRSGGAAMTTQAPLPLADYTGI